MNPALHGDGAWPLSGQADHSRDANERNDPPENRATLQLALRTLCGIRERYDMERTAHPDARLHRVHVALDDSDMVWIAATIEALGKPLVAGTTEAKQILPA